LNAAYFECFSGISGDMILGALFDLGLDRDKWAAEMSRLNLSESPEYLITREMRGAISAHGFEVRAKKQENIVRRFEDAKKILENSSLSDDIKEKSVNSFRRLLACEAKIHNMDIDHVHLHEISGLDTIIDVVGTYVAMEMLGIEFVASSPVNVGSGTVETQHGTLPVPAPATVMLLEGASVYSSGSGELTTPTGALLITELASAFGEMPLMTIRNSGYGAGRNNGTGRPNVLRIITGELQQPESTGPAELIYNISTNIDDMEPRAIGYLLEKIIDAGALDAFIQPVYMKKSRPGFVLSVLCENDFVNSAVEMILKETSTLGVRILPTPRICVRRENKTIETEFGPINVKLAYHRDEILRINPEYEDCAAAARETGRPVMDIIDKAKNIAVETLINKNKD